MLSKVSRRLGSACVGEGLAEKNVRILLHAALPNIVCQLRILGHCTLQLEIHSAVVKVVFMKKKHFCA